MLTSAHTGFREFYVGKCRELQLCVRTFYSGPLPLLLAEESLLFLAGLHRGNATIDFRLPRVLHREVAKLQSILKLLLIR